MFENSMFPLKQGNRYAGRRPPGIRKKGGKTPPFLFELLFTMNQG